MIIILFNTVQQVLNGLQRQGNVGGAGTWASNDTLVFIQLEM